MALKPNGSNVSLKEQIIEDLATGLTIQIEKKNNGTARLKIYGDFEFGNREFIFDESGALGATGTAIVGSCKANWLTDAS